MLTLTATFDPVGQFLQPPRLLFIARSAPFGVRDNGFIADFRPVIELLRVRIAPFKNKAGRGDHGCRNQQEPLIARKQP